MFDTEKRAYVALAPAEGAAPKEICLIPKMANRHGLITGATGTGKTVTLQSLAETFSQMGVPVFAADMKGDVSGMAAVGGNKSSVTKRVEEFGLRDKGFDFTEFPVCFWDVFGKEGVPVRATVSGMGPLLLSRLLSLNDTQSAVLSVLFKFAEDEKLELVDLKDLQKLLEYAAQNASALSAQYGNLPTASIAAIQRGVVSLANEGAADFFGEPALDIKDFMQQQGGRGVVNILAADKLMQTPKVYTSFLLWLMTRLFTELPEAGDLEKPKLVFFFDEAHLLFSDAPKALLDKVEQVIRLIRSKGVGIWFISQSPSDIPDSVLGQLGNRVQHALRAYTPKDQKALKAAAQSFRPNPAFDTESAISQLGIGEALVSFLDEKGVPVQVERAFILPPQSQIGPLDADARTTMVESSLLNRIYGTPQDRATAYELLSERLKNAALEKERLAQQKVDDAAAAKDLVRQQKEEERQRKEEERQRKEAERQRKEEEKQRLAREREAKRESERRQRAVGGVLKSLLVPLGRQILGGLLKRK